MRRQIRMPLLVARVLRHKVQILPADDEGAVHLGGDHRAGEDAAANTILPSASSSASALILLPWRPLDVGVCEKATTRTRPAP